MSYHDAAALGVQAEQLLGNKIFTDVWKRLEQKYADNWLISRPEDAEHREHLWRLRLNMLALKSELETMVRDGKVAAAELKAKEQMATVHRLNAVPG